MQVQHVELNTYGRLLLHTSSSMTEILELYHDAEVNVKILQQNQQLRFPSIFPDEENKNTIKREIILYNQETEQHLIYAFSILYVDNLSESVQNDLFNNSIPIGKIIGRHQLETYRIIESIGILENQMIASQITPADEDRIFYKLYTINMNHKPLFRICECFPFKQLAKA